MGLGSGCGYEDMGDEGMGFWFWIQDTRGRGFGVGYRIRGDGVLGLDTGYEDMGDEGTGLGSGCGYEDIGDEGYKLSPMLEAQIPGWPRWTIDYISRLFGITFLCT